MKKDGAFFCISMIIAIVAFIFSGCSNGYAHPIEGKTVSKIEPILTFAYNCIYTSTGAKVSGNSPFIEIPLSLNLFKKVMSLDLSKQPPRISAFIKLKGDVDELVDHGVNIRSKIGDIVTADFALSELATIAGLEDVEYIEVAKLVKPDLNISVPMVRTIEAWQEFGVYGEGVIIGIVDSGIDHDNLDFQHSIGTDDTRIQYLWDQNDNTGSPPFGYDYGREWSKDEIDNHSCTEEDRLGHGTYVAGIAAGNGRATGNGVPAGTYRGIAPEADLIIVRHSFPMHTDNVVDGLTYIGTKAANLGKPWVANLSLGTLWGPKDGTSPFEQEVFGITNQPSLGQGRIIVTSAGNFGYDPTNPEVIDHEDKYKTKRYHASKDGAGSATFTLETTTTIDDECTMAEVWYPEGQSYKISIATPNNVLPPETYSWGPGEGTGDPGYGYITNDGLIAIHNNHFASSGDWRDHYPFTPDNQIIIALEDCHRDGYQVDLASGSWTITLSNGNGRWDSYILIGYETTVKARFDNASHDNSRKIGEPGNAKNVITVGSFNSKNNWIDINGHNQPQYDNLFNPAGYPIGEISFFSSPGPTRDGRLKPDIYAPGAWIASSTSHDRSDLESSSFKRYRERDGWHHNSTGTSASAPHVTGTVALMLEREPNLTPEGVKQILIASSSDGKLDVYTALELTGIGQEEADLQIQKSLSLIQNYPNPFNPRTEVGYALPKRVKTKISIYNLLGQEVKTLVNRVKPAGYHIAQWDGRDNDGKYVASGVYFCRMEAGSFSETKKMLLIR